MLLNAFFLSAGGDGRGDSPLTPGWVSGKADLFKTPATVSPPKRRMTRR